MGTKSLPNDDEEVLQLSEAIIGRVKWSYKSLLERRGLKMQSFLEKFGSPVDISFRSISTPSLNPPPPPLSTSQKEHYCCPARP